MGGGVTNEYAGEERAKVVVVKRTARWPGNMRCYALLSRPDGRMNSLAGAPVGLAVNVSIKMLSNLVCNTWLIPVLRFYSPRVHSHHLDYYRLFICFWYIYLNRARFALLEYRSQALGFLKPIQFHVFPLVSPNST